MIVFKKFRHRLLQCLFATLVFVSGCVSAPPPADPSSVEQLRWLDTADPQTDLRAALKRRDTRFFAVFGYAADTPGVPWDSPELRRHGMKYIHGTSDAVRGREHGRLNSKAKEYAGRYNRLLLHYLRTGRLRN